MCVWDLAKNKLLQTLGSVDKKGATSNSVAMSFERKIIVAAFNSTIYLWRFKQ